MRNIDEVVCKNCFYNGRVCYVGSRFCTIGSD